MAAAALGCGGGGNNGVGGGPPSPPLARTRPPRLTAALPSRPPARRWQRRWQPKPPPHRPFDIGAGRGRRGWPLGLAISPLSAASRARREPRRGARGLIDTRDCKPPAALLQARGLVLIAHAPSGLGRHALRALFPPRGRHGRRHAIRICGGGAAGGGQGAARRRRARETAPVPVPPAISQPRAAKPRRPSPQPPAPTAACGASRPLDIPLMPGNQRWGQGKPCGAKAGGSGRLGSRNPGFEPQVRRHLQRCVDLPLCVCCAICAPQSGKAGGKRRQGATVGKGRQRRCLRGGCTACAGGAWRAMAAPGVGI